MRISRDLTIAGLARHLVGSHLKECNRLKQQVELLKNESLRTPQQNFRIRRRGK